jgi:hypothetical protein
MEQAKMKTNTKRWSFARILFVVSAAGAGVAGDGCGCDEDAPYVDDSGELQCGDDCRQYAYACQDGRGVCAPDDYTAGVVWNCQWTEKKECFGGVGDTGPGGETGLDGGEAGDPSGNSGADTTAGDPVCAQWDPDSHVLYNRQTKTYEIDQVLVDDLQADASPLTECDGARRELLSGGYWQVVGIEQDDLARHLGLAEGDRIRAINGIDLRLPEDYLTALTQLQNATTFVLSVTRGTRTVSLNYVVR